jgi:hypothetical protein
MSADGTTGAPANALASCLGADFNRLVPTVQQAHLGDIRLDGTVAVTRGRGPAGLLAALMRMPPTDPHCRMTVNGRHFADRMIWQRDFAGRKMESCFVKSGNHLVEAMGSIRLDLHPACIDGRLHYQLRGARIGPIRLPTWLAPKLIAWEGEADGFYEFEVDIGLPLIGRLIRYMGRLKLVT